MKLRDGLIVAAVSIIMFTIFILYNNNSNSTGADSNAGVENEQTVEYARNSYNFEMNEYPEPPRPKSGTWVPEGWTGLPISYDNDLYKHPNESPRYQSAFKGVLKTLLTTPRKEIIENDELWIDLAAKYTPELGWNGFFDAMQEAYKFNLDDISSRFHSIGEILVGYTKKPRHAVEITSRNYLHKAPLHGAVWQIIMNFKEKNEDNNAMFDLVKNELCYFKDYDGMANTWISCKFLKFKYQGNF